METGAAQPLEFQTPNQTPKLEMSTKLKLKTQLKLKLKQRLTLDMKLKLSLNQMLRLMVELRNASKPTTTRQLELKSLTPNLKPDWNVKPTP